MGTARPHPGFRDQEDASLPGNDQQHLERAQAHRGGGASFYSPEASPPLLVPVTCAGRSVVAVTDQIRAVAKERLEQCMGTISAEDLAGVEDGLRQILELG